MQESQTELSDSKLKTSKACFQMFEKWKKTDENPKAKSVAHYVDACINGYPKGTKISPALLKTRVNGIMTHSIVNKLNIPDNEFVKAAELIQKYRESSKS